MESGGKQVVGAVFQLGEEWLARFRRQGRAISHGGAIDRCVLFQLQPRYQQRRGWQAWEEEEERGVWPRVVCDLIDARFFKSALLMFLFIYAHLNAIAPTRDRV